MDDDQELVCHLFVKTSELAEIAHKVAVSGQVNCSSDQYSGHAQQLKGAYIGIQSIAEAIATIIGGDLK